MEWISYLVVAIIFLFIAIGMAELIELGALVLLGFQAFEWLKTGVWRKHTIASQFDMTAAPEFTGWVIIDKVIRYVIFDIEIAFVIAALGVVAIGVKQCVDSTLPRRSQNQSAKRP